MPALLPEKLRREGLSLVRACSSAISHQNVRQRRRWQPPHTRQCSVVAAVPLELGLVGLLAEMIDELLGDDGRLLSQQLGKVMVEA